MKELTRTALFRRILLVAIAVLWLISIRAQVLKPASEIRSEPLSMRRLEKPLLCQVYVEDTAASVLDTLTYQVPRVLRVRMPARGCRERMFKPANTEILIQRATGQSVGYAIPIGELTGLKIDRSRLSDWDETRLSRSAWRPRRRLFSRTWEFPLGCTYRSSCMDRTMVLVLDPGEYTVTFRCRNRFEDAPIDMGSTRLIVSETH